MKYVKQNELIVVSDEKSLEKLCKEAIKEKPELIDKIKKGDMWVLNFFVGKIMKKTKGAGDPKIILKILKKIILNY